MDFVGFDRFRSLKSASARALILLISIAGEAQAEDRSDLGALNLNLRTIYFNRDKDQGNANSIAAVQAARLDYISPYIGDLIGFDGSIFTSLKLAGEKGRGSTFLLRDEPNGGQSSYWKLGQILVKLRLLGGTVLKAGRMVLDKPLLEEDDSRATPSSTQALFLETSVFGASLYAIASDKASGKTEGKFFSYQNSSGEDFNIYVLGAEREFDNGLTARVSYGFADDIMQQGYLNLSYRTALPNNSTLQLDAHQYIGDAVGNGALAGIGTGYGSALTNLAAAFSHKTIKLSASYQMIKGDGYQVSWDNNHDETGFATLNSVHRMDFNRSDEDSIQLRLDYDFKSYVDGLSFMARYIHGSDIRRTDGQDGHEWVRDVELIYAAPMVEGLKFRWRYSNVRSSETYGSDENRVLLNYSRKFN